MITANISVKYLICPFFTRLAKCDRNKSSLQCCNHFAPNLLLNIPFYDLIPYESRTISLWAFFIHLFIFARKRARYGTCFNATSHKHWNAQEIVVYFNCWCFMVQISEKDDTLQPSIDYIRIYYMEKINQQSFFARYYSSVKSSTEYFLSRRKNIRKFTKSTCFILVSNKLWELRCSGAHVTLIWCAISRQTMPLNDRKQRQSSNGTYNRMIYEITVKLWNSQLFCTRESHWDISTR